MTEETKRTHLGERVEELRAGLNGLDPAALAARVGGNFAPSYQQTSGIELAFWGQPVILSFPDLIARESSTGEGLPVNAQALLLYYCNCCDGTPISGQWISFSELPGGRFYNQAFQGYTGQSLARSFGEDLAAFCQAAERLGGKKTSFGEVAFSFQVFPRVPLLAVYWRGDEDFPASCQILFDQSINHHLPTDACAIIGSQLTQKLIQKLLEERQGIGL